MELNQLSRRRIYFFAMVFVFCLVSIAYKLCVEHSKTPDDRVVASRKYVDSLKALRGKIFDCNGQQPMAVSHFTRRYFVDPHACSVKMTHRTNLVHMVTDIAQAFSLDVDDVWSKFLTISQEQYNQILLNNDDPELWEKKRSHNRYNVLAESRDEGVYSLIMNSALVSGVGVENKVARFYPENRRMAHVIGFVNDLGQGGSGIEQKYDVYLQGTDGRIEGIKDALRREIFCRRVVDLPPIHGADVYLTLDSAIQDVVERVLHDTVEKFNAQAGWSIIQRVKTGEILAMASFPDFAPQSYSKSDSDKWINRAIMVNYEAGSVIKPVIACAALNQGTIDADTLVDVGSSNVWFFAGRPLRDHIRGTVGMRDALAHSSNIYFGKLGLLMGNESIYNNLHAFGFGEKPGCDLPGAQYGIIHHPDRWDKLMPTRIPLGYGVAVTALQLVNAFACIFNDGALLKPYVVDRVVSCKGDVLMKNKPQVIGRPVRKEVARSVREMLAGVVRTGGTGTRAAVEGYTVAGKTGTAQKAVPGGYSQTDYYSTFVGCIPASDPEIVILVTVDAPDPQHTGGFVAAPAFSRIATEVVEYLEISPDDLSVETVNSEGSAL